MVTIEDTGLNFTTADFAMKQGELHIPVLPGVAPFRNVVTSMQGTTVVKRYAHKGSHRNDAVNRLNWWRDVALKLAMLAATVWVYFMTALLLRGFDSAEVLFYIESALLIASAGFTGMYLWLRFSKGKHARANFSSELNNMAIILNDEVVIGQ